MSNKLSQGWKKVKISDVSEVVSGGTPSTKNEAFYNGEIGWITPKDLSRYTKKYIKNGARNITALGLEKSSAKLLPKGTVLLSSRAPIGYLSIAEGELSTNQGFKNLVCNKDKLDNIFIYYYLKSKKDDLEQIASGSTFKEVSGNTLKNFEIKIPSDINEQKRIADILSAFDDKIENNNQINQTLEEMASALFKEWFENFNFPNSQGKPYKDSGGEMKASELGEIPVDWEVQSLKDISKIISKGTTPRKIDVDGLDSTVLFLKVKDINNDGTINFDSLEKIPNIVHQKQLKRSILKLDDILVSIAGTIGRTSITPKELDNANCNQAIAFIRLKDKEKYKKYVYQWIKTSLVQSQINSGIVQGVQANVSLTTLGNLNITIPDKILIEKFNNMFSPIFEQIQQNQQQNQILKQQRDALLPKLISGEIRV